MADLATLPVEILSRIFYYAERQACWNLRLTSRLLANIGKPLIFEQVRLSPTREGYERLDRSIKEPRLLQNVARICLDIRKWVPGEQSELYESGRESDEEGHGLPKELLSALRRFLDSPKFRSIVVRFHHEVQSEKHYWEFANQNWQCRLEVLSQVMSLLVSSTRLPQELAIQDLQNINATDPNMADSITKVLGTLQTLRINISNENFGSRESGYELEEPHRFFAELPSFWLKPTVSNLRHLTLYSTHYFGFYPKCDLRGVHFPQLRTLSFGNHTFVDDSQLDWILSHGTTLTELYLDDCPILLEMGYLDPSVFAFKDEPDAMHYITYGARWCDYLCAFREGLPVLRHFRMGRSPHWWDDETTPFGCETTIPIELHDASYMLFCDKYGASPYVMMNDYGYEDGEPLLPSEEDRKALEELLEKIGQTDGRISGPSTMDS